MKIMIFGFGKEEDKKKMRKMGRGKQFLSFYTLGNYSFPFKKSCLEVRHLFKIVDMCPQGEMSESLTSS